MLMTLERSLNPLSLDALSGQKSKGQALYLLPACHQARKGLERPGRNRIWPACSRDAVPYPTLRAHPHSGAHSALPPPPREHEVPGHPSSPSHSPRGLASEYHSGDDGPVSWRPLGEKTQGSPALRGVRGPLYFCISNLEKPSRPHMLSYVGHRPGTEKPPRLGTSTPCLHLLCPNGPPGESLSSSAWLMVL